MTGGWRPIGAAIALAWRTDPGRCALAGAGTLLMSVQPLLLALLAREAVDAVVAHDAGRAGAYALGLALAVAGQIALMWFTFGLRTVVEEKTRHEVEMRLAEACTRSWSLRRHDEPALADELGLVERDISRLAAVLIFVLTLLGAVAQLVVVVAALGSVDPRLIALPLLGLLPVWAGRRGDAPRQAALTGAAAGDRLAAELYELGCRPAHAEELATGGRSGLRDRFREVAAAAQAGRERGEVAAARPVLLATTLLGVAYTGAVLIALLAAVRAHASIGDVLLTVTLGALVSGQVGLIVDMAVLLIRSQATAGRYLSVLDRLGDEPSGGGEAPPAGSPIRLHGVTFTYPGAGAPALRDVDLTVRPGEVVAVVGENGAGKTTLGKLLLRLHDPDAGWVEVGGRDLREIDVGRWRAGTSAAYQDFARFEFTAGDSVGIGDLGHASTERIVDALDRADGRDLLTRLPDGLDTRLGASFDDGIDLSAGQWQRIAVGRALMRHAPALLVLDEPTASLDPEAEYRLLQRYAAAAGTASAVLVITHRLGSVRLADRVVVLDGGTVAEAGTHDELIAAGGRYARLLASQADAYRTTDS